MPRKVFISFLGTTPYTECVYTFGDKKSKVVKYTQTALNEWFHHDKIFIFTTDEAIETTTKDGKIIKSWEGLQTELQGKPVENVMIPNGESESEIWNIFQEIFYKLEKDDVLTVDITHGFRSSPFLFSALLQYAKFLKNITINGVYYGAFNYVEETKKFPNNPEQRIGKIFDLTAFTEIQDWATAAHNFIAFGDAERLTSLMDNSIFDSIAGLCNAVKTNRGLEIIEGTHQQQILDEIRTISDQDEFPARKPILQKIQQDIETIYKGKNDTKNMLAAVQWCIDKKLIQAGVTLLQEGIVTVLLDGIEGETFTKAEPRLCVASFIQYHHKFDKKKGWSRVSKEEAAVAEEYLGKQESFEKLITIIEGEGKDAKNLFGKIAELRNNINHAGMSGGSQDFQSELEKLYTQVKTIFNL